LTKELAVVNVLQRSALCAEKINSKLGIIINVFANVKSQLNVQLDLSSRRLLASKKFVPNPYL